MRVILINKAIRIYKNNKMFKDTIMIDINDLEVLQTKNIDNITMLYNDEELVGINIFDSNLFNDFADGFIYPKADVLKVLNAYLNKYDLNFKYNKHDYLKVGLVQSVSKVEGSDSLSLCEVLVDNKIYSIVCGAQNVKANMKTIVALDNALLESGLLIKDSKVLDTFSQGMLCSKKELNLPQKPNESGIIELDDNEELNKSFFDWRSENV